MPPCQSSTVRGFFFEANPEDVNPENLLAWRRLGVQTLSLGVQSFEDSELRRLGRRHSAAEAVSAVQEALDAGFHSLSVDLIFGTPGQTAQGWLQSLEQAVTLAPQHISCYQLTVHEGTTFGRWKERGKLVEMPEGEQAELFSLTHQHLAQAGFAAYEVSNFARDAEFRSAPQSKVLGTRSLPWPGSLGSFLLRRFTVVECCRGGSLQCGACQGR